MMMTTMMMILHIYCDNNNDDDDDNNNENIIRNTNKKYTYLSTRIFNMRHIITWMTLTLLPLKQGYSDKLGH